MTEITNYHIHAKLVIDLCESLGYGFVMDEAAKAWHIKRGASSHRSGPCHAFTVPCPDHTVSCDICFGCGWIMKSHAQLLKARI